MRKTSQPLFQSLCVNYSLWHLSDWLNILGTVAAQQRNVNRMNRSCTYLILPLTVTMRLPSRGYSTAGGGVGNCTPQHGVFQLNQQLTQGLCLSHWVTLQSRTSHIKLLLLILTMEAKCPHDLSVSQKYPILPALPLVYLQWVRVNKKLMHK